VEAGEGAGLIRYEEFTEAGIMGLFDIFKNEKKQEQPAGTAQKTAGPVEIPSGIRYKKVVTGEIK
jgi:hypothetical protein